MPGDRENVFFSSWADVVAQYNFMQHVCKYQTLQFVQLSHVHQLSVVWLVQIAPECQCGVSLHAAHQRLALHPDHPSVLCFLHCFAAQQAYADLVSDDVDLSGTPQFLGCTR